MLSAPAAAAWTAGRSAPSPTKTNATPSIERLRAQVPDVVDIRFSLQHGQERSDDSLKWRVGHGQHDIAIKEERARQSQHHIAQVIHQAIFHVEPWKLR